MKRCRRFALLLLTLALMLQSGCASSEFLFSDDRFRNILTTENLDAIIDEYELYDGWYWTTQANIMQDFHGHPDTPGWTSSSEAAKHNKYIKGWYGCRWPVDRVMRTKPDKGGYAECFGFANFIGYLLSGELNPQHYWTYYKSIEQSGPLRVGDIIRSEYTKNGHLFQHSAVVYAVNGEEILFIQVSGSNYNKISIGRGFSNGDVTDLRSMEEIASLRGQLKISRYIVSE